MNSGDFCFSVSMDLAGDELYSRCNPNTDKETLRISVFIGATEWQFYLEERSGRIEKKGTYFSVWGRTKQAKLSSRFVNSISDTDTSTNSWQSADVVASSVIFEVSSGVTINLNVTDFLIYKGTLTVSNQYPIDIIKSIAEATGAELEPQVNGVLNISEYSVTEGDSVATYTDLDDIIQLSESEDQTAGYNAVTVCGYDVNQGSSITASLVGESQNVSMYIVEAEAYALYVENTMRLFHRHPDDATPLVYFPSGSYVELTTGTETKDEEIGLEFGSGQDSNGDEVTGDTSIPFALTTKSVSRNYIEYKFTVTANMYYEAKVFFYFEDKSATLLYEFPKLSSTERQEDGAVRVYNDSGEAIPSYAALEVTTLSDKDSGDPIEEALRDLDLDYYNKAIDAPLIIKVVKPTENDLESDKVLFTKSASIPKDSFGWAFRSDVNIPRRIRPQIGDTFGVRTLCGTIKNSWEMRANGTGFLCVIASTNRAYIVAFDSTSVRVYAIDSIPPYGVAEIASHIDGIARLRIPTADSIQPGKLMAAGPAGLTSGMYGRAFNLFDKDLRINVSGSPTAGDQIGTVNGSTTLATGKRGILVVGTGTGVSIVRPY